MSASRWSSSSRSCRYSYRRSSHSAIAPNHASGIFQDHPRSGNDREVASGGMAELPGVLPQDMFLLREGKGNNAWLRELVGRLSTTRVICLAYPLVVLKRLHIRV